MNDKVPEARPTKRAHAFGPGHWLAPSEVGGAEPAEILEWATYGDGRIAFLCLPRDGGDPLVRTYALDELVAEATDDEVDPPSPWTALAVELHRLADGLEKLADSGIPVPPGITMHLHPRGQNDAETIERIDAIATALLGRPGQYSEMTASGPGVWHYDAHDHRGPISIAILAAISAPTQTDDDPTGQGYSEVVREPEQVEAPADITTQAYPVRGDAARPVSAPVVGEHDGVPLCEHGDDAMACQLRHRRAVEHRSYPFPVTEVDPAEIAEEVEQFARGSARMREAEERAEMQTRPQCTPECQSQWPTEDWMPLMHLGGCPVALAQMQSGCE